VARIFGVSPTGSYSWPNIPGGPRVNLANASQVPVAEPLITGQKEVQSNQTAFSVALNIAASDSVWGQQSRQPSERRFGRHPNTPLFGRQPNRKWEGSIIQGAWAGAAVAKARTPEIVSYDLSNNCSSPVSLHRTETDAESFADSPTLELMLEQLVQATSDWDDSILIDDKFKSLLDSTKRSDHTSDADHQFTVEMKCSDSPPSPGIELPKLKDFDGESIAHPNPFLGSPYILRDRTRDLLFSIPEEDVISFTNIVIQTY
jgi:hypothetical protein